VLFNDNGYHIKDVCDTSLPAGSPSQHRDTYMIKMRLEAQSRRRRAMHTMSTGTSGVGPGDDVMKQNTSETSLARLARGELFDEEECLTDDEQLDVMPG